MREFKLDKQMYKNYLKLFLALILFSISFLAQAQNEALQQKTLNKAFKLINNQYVDTVNSAKLVEDAIKAMVANLDPHSKYMDSESVKRSNESIRGSFGGVGIHYQILDDTLIVLNTTEKGPSDLAGIKAGDKILKIDNEIACGKGVSNSFFSKKLRGKEGSVVQIQVLSHSDKKVHNFNVIRGAIPINTLEVAFMIDKNVGYIRLNMFSRSTMTEFNKALADLKSKGMKHLILDLRGNPGGLMIASIKLADVFLTEDKLIVYTQGEHYKRDNYISSENTKMPNGRLVVMMDEYSASASEIFGGAIQDWDRGLIMGRRSFGKGLVGRNFLLPDGAAMRLTTGRYYTPSGRSIQKSYADGRAAYNKDLDRRFKHGEFIHADSINVPDSLKFTTNGGRTVYGGGGIMPDVFLPLDTSYYSGYLRKVNHKGAINLFTGYYFDDHMEELFKQYPTKESFHESFQVDDKTLNSIRTFIKERFNIEANEHDWLVSKEYIRSNFKALLARNIFENGVFYWENADHDKMLQSALQTINNPKVFRQHGVQSK